MRRMRPIGSRAGAVVGFSCKALIRIAALVAVLLTPAATFAQPIRLKLSFFTSDRSNIYQYSVKPFVDAVNRDGRGLVRIETEFSSPITKVQVEQPQLVADDTTDMAIFAPGLIPNRFSDTAVMELAGLYRDMREAGLVFTRLIQAGALEGYDDFFVIGAFVSGAEEIHSRVPITNIKDLKGLTIRTNNNIEADVLRRFGAKPQRLSINQTTDAISRNKIDGATFPPSMLFEFGIGRLTKYHYMIKLGGAPNVLVMNRKKFESLPPRAQAIIRKYSGQWLVEHYATAFQALDKKIVERLESDPRRTVVFPSLSDVERAKQIFASVTEEWAARSPHNRQLLSRAKAEIARLRSGN